jgi:hypothetical protein
MSDNGYTQLVYASTATFGDRRLEDPETLRHVMQIDGERRSTSWSSHRGRCNSSRLIETSHKW